MTFKIVNVLMKYRFKPGDKLVTILNYSWCLVFGLGVLIFLFLDVFGFCVQLVPCLIVSPVTLSHF